jgi:Icc protein
MNRRELLIASNATIAFAAGVRPLEVSAHDMRKSAFSFAFMTDCHLQPELNAAIGCLNCFKQISKERFDFVIQGGDHVYDALEVDRKRANSLMDLYIETEQVIGIKIHHVIGNHDCFGVFPKSGVDPSVPDYGKQYYIERFGPTYYAFDHKGVHFVVLDSIGITADRSYEGRIDAAQLEWLRRDLAALPAGAPIIVISHIPLVTGLSCYEPLDWETTPHNWTNVVNARDVLAMLRGRKVLAVLQGHSHVAERVTLNGIPFITGGAVSGNWWQGSFLGTPEGYLEVTVDADRVDTRYVTYGFHSVDRKDVLI